MKFYEMKLLAKRRKIDGYESLFRQQLGSILAA